MIVEKLTPKIEETLNSFDYAEDTKRIYTSSILGFLIYYSNTIKSVNDLKRSGKNKVETYIDYLKIKGLSNSTQKIALTSLIFFYRNILRLKANWLYEIQNYVLRERKKQKILSRREISSIFSQLEIRDIKSYHSNWLIASLIYGSGLRLQECIELKIEDINLKSNEIIVKKKRNVDRTVVFLDVIKDKLNKQIEISSVFYNDDVKKEIIKDNHFQQYYLFPSERSFCEFEKGLKRNHIHHDFFIYHLRIVKKQLGLEKCDPKMLRNSFIVHALEDGNDIRTIQKMVGHKDLSTTKAFCELIEETGNFVSPLNSLEK